MPATKSAAAALSIISNSLLITLKLVAGLITGSISILAEAIHSLLDLAAAIIAFFGVRISDRPADKQHPFGHGKAENISGVAEAGLIFVAAGLIIYEAIKRLVTGGTVELLELGLGVMAVSIVVNIFVSRHLLKVSRTTDSIALEADARHLTTDVWTSAGVFVGLVVVWLTGVAILDPIIALIVALFILKAAYEILMRSFGGLVDVKLPEAEEKEIIACIKEHSGQLVGFHKLRTRKAGSQRFIELHLVVPKNVSVEKAHRLCDHLERDLRKRLPRISITIHIEPCKLECRQCSIVCSLRQIESSS